MSPDSPETLGPYQVSGRLGAGGMGEVFLAYDPRLDRQVAIKRIRTDSGDAAERRSRLQREAKVAAGLVHTSIVQVFDLLTLDDVDHIVMEYVPGKSLRRALEDGPLPLAEGLRAACAIADGLAYAHQKGVIHRDLKTENVLLSPEGEVKIADFGIARRLTVAGVSSGETLTRDGAVMGTFRAMSPEQACGDPLDARSDLFSFGVLLYETFTGASPFLADNNARTIERLFNHDPPPARERAPGVPPSLSDLIDHLIEKEPHLRPRDALEVAERLHAIEERARQEGEATMIAGATGSTDLAAPAAAAQHTEVTQTIRTLMVTDLVASTDLTSRLGDRRAMKLSARHDHVARTLVARHGGREIDKSDGFLLLFERPIEAVRCALDYHAALAELSSREGVELKARTGIHLGEVFLRENPAEDVRHGAKPLEVEGIAKATAARLAGLAGGGQTLLTRGAFDLAQRAAADLDPGERPLRFMSHGRYRFKGVEESMEICEIGVERRSPLRPPTAVGKAQRVGSGGKQRQRWIVAAVVAAVAVAVAVGVKLWPEPPLLSVAVLKPKVHTGSGLDSEEASSLAYTARNSLQRALAGIESISPKTFSEIDYVSGTSTEVARAVAADELIESTITCRARVCDVDLYRVQASDASLITIRKFAISVDDPAATTARAVTVGLRELFRSHRTRPEMGRFEVAEGDYEDFLEIKRTFDAGKRVLSIPEMLDRLKAIRQGSSSFVDAYLLEADIAARGFTNTKDRTLRDHALKLLNQAQELASGDPDVFFKRAYVETRVGQLDGAEDTLRILEDLAPADPRLLDIRAGVLSERGQDASALDIYKLAARRSPSWQRLYNYARCAHRVGEIALAKEILEDLLSRSPGNSPATSLLASIELTAGDPSRAVELYGDLDKLTPPRLSNLGLAHMLLGDYSAAADALERAVTEAPDDPMSLSNLAEIRALQGHPEESERLFRQALAIIDAGKGATSVQELTIKAQVLAHLGEHLEAVSTMEAALRKSPEHGGVAFAAALVSALVGDQIAARVHAERAIDLGYRDRNWFRLPWFDALRNNAEFTELISESAP